MTLEEMLPLMHTSSEREVKDVERVAYPFYCQKLLAVHPVFLHVFLALEQSWCWHFFGK